MQSWTSTAQFWCIRRGAGLNDSESDSDSHPALVERLVRHLDIGKISPEGLTYQLRKRKLW